MRTIQSEFQASYRPIPHTRRFWMYSERCYTQEELNFRDWLLKTRANSGIHPDYLANPNSWFGDNSQALINEYEHSWTRADAFRTRHVINRDEFYVEPIDSQRLQWPALHDLMQNTGDYLLTRNELLPDEHLNQPMNFIFLDINHMLKGLSQNPSSAQVKEQLEQINKYLRTVEKKISPTVGSDRLFLANFRRTIDENILPKLTHLIEAQLLKERLNNLNKTIKKLSTERNRILHFALNSNPVNPHPYEFASAELKNTITYPTQAAKACADSSTAVSTSLLDSFHLTVKQLNDCPNFKLIIMNDEVLGHYAKAITDLNELQRFQTMIAQTMSLLDQAGEVYTVHQFKNQILNLLNQINVFIDDSASHIQAIAQANTQAYHDAIQIQQNLSVWDKWFSSEKEKLKTFIKNQDMLSQFPSSAAELAKTNSESKEQVSQVISHLNQPRTIESSFEAIAGQTQELNKLMLSMHDWIKNQYESKGLPSPTSPEPIALIQQTPAKSEVSSTSLLNKIAQNSSRTDLHFPPLFAPSAPPRECANGDGQCVANAVQPETHINLVPYVIALSVVPLALLALYLIASWKSKPAANTSSGTKEEYKELKVKFEDLMTVMNGLDKSNKSKFVDDYQHDYEVIKRNAKRGMYDTDNLNELCNNMETDIELATRPRHKFMKYQH